MQRVEIIGVDTSSLPKIGAKESLDLIKKIRQGDEQSRELFITANLRLVLSVVKRFGRKGVDRDDLFQIGCVGLLKALNNFDVSQNVQFSTYAVPMIIGEIRRFLRDSSGIKVSRNLRDIAYKALKAQEELTAEYGARPGICEISEEIGLPVSEIACALDAVSDTVSYFDPVFDDGEDSMLLMDQLADKKNTESNWLDNIDLTEGIKTVPEKEREVLYLRYYIGKTQTEISRSVNISQAQVSRLEKNAIERLRRQLTRQ